MPDPRQGIPVTINAGVVGNRVILGTLKVRKQNFSCVK